MEKTHIFRGEEGKGGKYLEKENILFVEERKNGEEKGGEHLKRKMCFFVEEKKTEKEKEENILRKKVFFCRGKEKGGKYIFVSGEAKRRRKMMEMFG